MERWTESQQRFCLYFKPPEGRRDGEAYKDGGRKKQTAESRRMISIENVRVKQGERATKAETGSEEIFFLFSSFSS